MTTTSLTTFQRPPGSRAAVSPNPARFKGVFEIRSSSSNAWHRISYDAAAGWWTCSCRGNIAHGHCQHLRANDLKGRKWVKETGQRVPLPRFVEESP